METISTARGYFVKPVCDGLAFDDRFIQASSPSAAVRASAQVTRYADRFIVTFSDGQLHTFDRHGNIVSE